MANLPLRDLGQIGLITDTNPYTLPPNALSKALNVVFDDNRIQRAPVFKQLFPAIRTLISYSATADTYASNTGTYDAAIGTAASALRFSGYYADPVYGETLFVCDNDGAVRSYPNGSLELVTPSGTLVTNDEPWTHAQVAGLSLSLIHI
jgi:hypothetical protein